MTKAILQHDLRQHTHDRIFKIVEDTFALYDMVQLEPCDAAQGLTDVLVEILSLLLASSTMDTDEIGRHIAHKIKLRRASGEGFFEEVGE